MIIHVEELHNPHPVDALLPSVETMVFAPRPEAKFWLGVTALGPDILEPEITTAAGVLRANVYIDEQRFLPTEARLANGTETDESDALSTHFSVLENRAGSLAPARVVGNARLIHKSNEEETLPVEALFPEAFATPASVNSVEASRFIARYPTRLTQSAISLSLIRAMALRSHNRGFEPAYAVVEESLARLFRRIGMPYEQIAEKKYLPEYRTENMAIRIQPSEILDVVAQDEDASLLLTHFFGTDVVDNEGVGYFDETMLSPVAPKVA